MKQIIETDIITTFEFRGKDSRVKIADFLRQRVATATLRSKNQLACREALTQDGGWL